MVKSLLELGIEEIDHGSSLTFRERQEAEEDAFLIQDCLSNALNAIERKLILLKYRYKLCEADIAVEIGCLESAIPSQIKMSKKKLRQCLKSKGIQI